MEEKRLGDPNDIKKLVINVMFSNNAVPVGPLGRGGVKKKNSNLFMKSTE